MAKRYLFHSIRHRYFLLTVLKYFMTSAPQRMIMILYSEPIRDITIDIALASRSYILLAGKLQSPVPLPVPATCARRFWLYLNTMLVTYRCNNKALSREAPLKLVQPRVVPNLFIKLVRRRAACGTSHCLLALSTILQTQHQFSTVPIKLHRMMSCFNYMFILVHLLRL